MGLVRILCDICKVEEMAHTLCVDRVWKGVCTKCKVEIEAKKGGREYAKI